MDRQETIADIIAEKRRRADELESKIIAYKDNPSKDLALETLALSLVAENRNEADRLEAAYRREVAVSKTETTTGDAKKRAPKLKRGEAGA